MTNRRIVRVIVICVVTIPSLVLLSQCQIGQLGPELSPSPPMTVADLTCFPTAPITVTPGGMSPTNPTAEPSIPPPMIATNLPSFSPAPATAPLSEASSTPMAPEWTAEPPVIVGSIDFQNNGGGKAVISLRGLNTGEYDRRIDVGEMWGLQLFAVMDDEANIYLPVSRFNKSDVLYIAPPHEPVKQVAVNTQNIYACQSWHGKIIFAAGGTGWNNIIIMEEGFSPRVVAPRVEGLYSLVKGEGNNVIALDDSPVAQNGKQFARAMIVDLNSGEVAERLLPAPQSRESMQLTSPGVKYGLMFVGVST